jgi:hypothetical protein
MLRHRRSLLASGSKTLLFCAQNVHRRLGSSTRCELVLLRTSLLHYGFLSIWGGYVGTWTLLRSPLRFDVLLSICPFSFGTRGHLRARGAISTGVLVHSVVPLVDLSRMPAELEGFRLPIESSAAGRSSMHTFSFFPRDPGHFEKPVGVSASITRLLLLP